MSAVPNRHVFVYGTLRRGEVRDINRLQPAPRWVGQGRVAGVLYDLGSYPGLVLQPSGEMPHDTPTAALHDPHVVGEVYSITPELERQLDAIEEVWPQQTGEYIRREVPVLMAREAAAAADAFLQVLVCLLYEIAADRVVGKPRIASGDWVRRGDRRL
ncbi:gamma-glutamylcyclotransferase family protein [Polaromonas sp. YR568]|uniref:gamma-glutamylcyclotransferase family protein n=1 Tax=Polaromonas sp. YR568 TaxID=1855301 RepID=UPI003138259F